MKHSNLQDRLIRFSVQAIKLVDHLKPTKAASHVGGELLRSATSPSLNYAEANAAESRKDFIHKLKIVLKELRESAVCLKIITLEELSKRPAEIPPAHQECDELIAIFVQSLKTATGSQVRPL